MLTALLTGFFLGLSLIIAIGAQNAFVLRQGVLRQHIFFIALFCWGASTVTPDYVSQRLVGSHVEKY